MEQYKNGVMSKPFVFKLIKYLNHQDFSSFYSILDENLKSAIDKSNEWEKRLDQLDKKGEFYSRFLNIENVKRVATSVSKAKQTVRTIIALDYISTYIHTRYTFTEIYNMSQIPVPLDSSYCDYCEYKPDPPKRISEYLPFLVNLEILELDTIESNCLKNGMFEKLPQLIELRILHDEPIRELPMFLFRNLNKLEKLSLESNKRKYEDTHTLKDTLVLENIFKGLHHLKYLHFSNKKIQSLPETIFKDLFQLEELKIYTGRVKVLPEKIFKSLVILRNLHFNYSNIETLPEKLFEGLIHLENINFYYNNIKTIPEKLFANLVNLEKLDLSDNNITLLYGGIFKDLKKLKFLHFSNNLLTSFPDKIFEGLVDLEYIRFSNNKIMLLAKDIFTGLVNLTRLDFTRNKITPLDGNIFKGLVNLIDLDFSENCIANVPAGILFGLGKLSNKSHRYAFDDQTCENVVEEY